MLATFVLHFAHPIHSYNDKPSPSEVERGLTSKMVGQPIIYQLLVYNIYIDINVPRDVGKSDELADILNFLVVISYFGMVTLPKGHSM